MKNSTVYSATALALLAALISGTNNFVTKIAVTVVNDPIYYTTLKNSLVALLVIGLIVGLKKFSEIRVLTKKQWMMLAAIGAIGGSLPFALYFTGLTMTTALNAGLIHKTLFLWVALLAFTSLKERLTGKQWLGVTLIFLGNLFVGGFTGFKWNAGELMIFGATLLWAVENIIAKKVLSEVSSVVVVAARMVLGSVILLTYLVFTGRLVALAVPSAPQIGWVLLSSVLLFGFVLSWFTALKHAPATYVATLLVPATLVTNILSAIFITHAFTGMQFTSGVFYVIGLSLLVLSAKKMGEAEAHSTRKSLSGA